MKKKEHVNRVYAAIHVVYYIKDNVTLLESLVPDPSDKNSVFQMDTHDGILEPMSNIYAEVDLYPCLVSYLPFYACFR